MNVNFTYLMWHAIHLRLLLLATSWSSFSDVPETSFGTMVAKVKVKDTRMIEGTEFVSCSRAGV